MTSFFFYWICQSSNFTHELCYMDSNMKLQQSRHSWQKWIFKIRLNCCLFIDSKYNYLAASPYIIVRKNAADNFFSLFLVDDDDGVFYLKPNCYYMHVQNQLNVCKKGKCLFVDFTFTDYWNGCILSKLQLFYKKHYRQFLAENL